LRHKHSKDQVNENFHSQAELAFSTSLNTFKKQAAALVVEGSGWGEHVSAHEKDLAFQLRALINNAREKELDKLQSLTLQQAKDRIEQIVNAPIYELNPGFWEEIKTPYMTELKDLASSCDQILKQGFQCNEPEVNQFMQSLEATLHQFTVEYVRRLFRDINTNLLRKFSKGFKKDNDGKTRDWRAIEEAKIREIWSACRNDMLNVIKEFKYIKMSRTALTEALEESRKPIT